jgi:probable phosphoglycerate mutase
VIDIATYCAAVMATEHRQHRFARPPGAAELLLVRHGESAAAVDGIDFPTVDGQGDPPLHPDGEQQAIKVADRLQHEDISAIYVTTLQRTVQTAAPLAEARHITPVTLPPGDVDGLVARLHALGPNDRALVVGHSNTVPVILSALDAGTVTIADDEHDNLFIVVPRSGARPTSLRIRY